MRQSKYHDIEHIIIDGGSRDDTHSILSRHADHLALVISEPDKGIYDAMNKGLARATGDIVGFLNSDDEYYSVDSLNMIAAGFSSDDIDAVYGDLIYIDAIDTSKTVRYWRSRPYQPGLCSKGWMPAHPTFYARRRIYELYGHFDLNFRLQADFDICMRFLHVHQIKTRYIPELLVRMRMGGASNASWRNVLRGNLEASAACRKYGLPGGPLFILRKLLSRLPQFLSRPKVS